MNPYYNNLTLTHPNYVTHFFTYSLSHFVSRVLWDAEGHTAVSQGLEVTPTEETHTYLQLKSYNWCNWSHITDKIVMSSWQSSNILYYRPLTNTRIYTFSCSKFDLIFRLRDATYMMQRSSNSYSPLSPDFIPFCQKHWRLKNTCVCLGFVYHQRSKPEGLPPRDFSALWNAAYRISLLWCYMVHLDKHHANNTGNIVPPSLLGLLITVLINVYY